MPTQSDRSAAAQQEHSGLISRRGALGLLGASGSALYLAGLTPRAWSADPAAPQCIARPAQTEGPYFVDAGLERSDIRSDPRDGSVKPGVPLELEFRVLASSSGRCAPLPGAIVDVWHCDAQGVYSGVRDPGFDTVNQLFLRGFQTTDAEGRVRFRTIYPGWYEGRAVHVHFKVRQNLAADRALEFTSQLYFDDALNQRVHAQPPYTHPGGTSRTVRNDRDGFFQDGGSDLLLPLTARPQGYSGSFELALVTA